MRLATTWLLMAGLVSTLGCGRINFDKIPFYDNDAGSAFDAAFNAQPLETCNDGLLNDGESATDCGGPCAACMSGQRCNQADDCLQGVCSNNICQAASCVDGVRNGDESDIDCGGACETKCAERQRCQTTEDCQATPCSGGTCAEPSCMDGIKNGDESDIDCGGTCAGCIIGQICTEPLDCASKVCSSSMCVGTSCANGIQDATETDVDCGGEDCAGTCMTGQSCEAHSDCMSGICDLQGTRRCLAASCTDGVKNQDESDIDCGGTCGAICQVGQACAQNTDCESSTCSGDQCREAGCVIQATSFTAGEANPNNPCEHCDPSSATDAWTPRPVGSECDDGAACTASSSCDATAQCTGTIAVGRCYIENQCWYHGDSNPSVSVEYCNAELDQTSWSAPSCSDGVLNGDEEGPDCGGSCSPCMTETGACISDYQCVTGGWGALSCCSKMGKCTKNWNNC